VYVDIEADVVQVSFPLYFVTFPAFLFD